MTHNRFLGILLGSTFTLSANAATHINEIMVRNASAIINENFNFEGWVELYNSGDEDVDMSKLYFANSDDDHFQWASKDSSILKPKQYAVFYFDELDKGNHASFKLDADGGVLILSDEKGNELDRLKYPKTYRNTSYGRTVDGGETFGHFLTATIGQSNIAAVATAQTNAPLFSEAGGFYGSPISVAISAPNPLATIYYTTDGSEPKVLTGTKYTGPINISSTTVLRAIAVTDGEIHSDISTASYFVMNEIPASFKVVSLSSDNEFLFGDELGAFAVGTNGSTVPSYCSGGERRANYMNDWDRPCNIEIFDEGKVQRINQEVKVGAFGACSRTKAVKSIKVKANKVYGTNKLDYPIFTEKPNLKWKSIVLRNSGNDFGRMLFRDGFLQTLAASGMDIDHQAYEPAVVFVNGNYYGMLGIRERTNKDFVYSNYGLDEEDFCIEENPNEAEQCDSYQKVIDIASTSNIPYDSIDAYIDVNEMLNYFSTQIFYNNQDWAGGNIKAWKRNEDGKWRWLLYDTEFSTSLYGNYLQTNGFTYAAKAKFFPLIIKNPEVKKRLINKFVLHTGTVFSEENVSMVLDSLLNIVHDEADYYFNYIVKMRKNEVGSWRNECEKVRNYITARPTYLFPHISSQLGLDEHAPLHICSDVKGTTYELNGLDFINKTDFRSYYFKNLELGVKAIEPDGYKFKEWQVCKEKYLIPFGTEWKNPKRTSVLNANWKYSDFDDSSWGEDEAPLGTGLNYFTEGRLYSTNSITYYVRNSFNIDDLASAGDLQCTMKVNDGAIVYLNGFEVYRFNLPTDEPLTDTLNAALDMDSYATLRFNIDKKYLAQGKNIVAVELHNAYKSTSIGFDMAIQDSNNQLEVLSSSPMQNFTTTFGDSLTLKAVFDVDPAWTKDSIKLYLNEICVANKQYVDDYREDDDWIEIYNDGSTPVDLGGMYISDKRTELTRYQIPTGFPEETTVPAKGYLIIWADADSSSQGLLHTNFQLNAKKEQTVTLSRMLDGELQVIDSIRYKTHVSGNSYSRFSYEGDGAWEVTSLPTFAARNAYAPEHTSIFEVLADNREGFEVRVYPNPVDDFLWFAFADEADATVSIVDYTGQLIKRKSVENGSCISVRDLKPSVYIVMVQSGNQTVSTKFVKR